MDEKSKEEDRQEIKEQKERIEKLEQTLQILLDGNMCSVIGDELIEEVLIK